ncbi:MAG: hypothetical protein Q8P88_01500 [Candidatus Jorgensenbacteria bacterium]|nr:hypothetical protein [Candidatus Jorgensenbacteria bacterium]
MNRKIFFIICVLALSGALSVISVSAASFDLPNIQCPAGLPCPSASAAPPESPAEYIARFYQIAIAIAGILGVAMIVAGSLFYTFSGGSSDRHNTGKEMITSALWGIALLFGSYLVLNTINPELTSLSEPEAPAISTETTNLAGKGLLETNAVAACRTWKIAGRVQSCTEAASSSRANACRLEMEAYNEKFSDCSESLGGGGAYIFRTKGEAVDARCHPYLKDFANKIYYTPTQDATNNLEWTAAKGEWFFCPIHSSPTK